MTEQSHPTRMVVRTRHAPATIATPIAWRSAFMAATIAAACFLAGVPLAAKAAAPAGVRKTIDDAQRKIVKIVGAGGFRGMEPYQSGILISADGYVLTAWSYVLDTDAISVTLDDGRKMQASLVGADPRIEAAVLKIDGTDLPYFDLRKSVSAAPGARVFVLSNVFNVAQGNEAASVQEGVISVQTPLAARRGVFETPYHGPAYVIDAVTNNPGAAGGALVTRRGELVAILGKELRNAMNDTWLNYAIPIEELRKSVEEIEAGKFIARKAEDSEKKPEQAVNLSRLGIILVPDVLERTPPFIDGIQAGSAADQAGCRPDDLVVLAGDRLIQSCKSLAAELEYIDHEEPVRLTVIRGRELIELTVKGSASEKNP